MRDNNDLKPNASTVHENEEQAVITREERRKQVLPKNLIVAGLLLALVALFYAISIVRMSGA